MKRILFVSAGLLALGTACQSENQLTSKGDIYGEPNPPSLESPVQEDSIIQVTTPSVDVLWVIDNSCSMSEEQAKLASNFPLFMEYFLDSGLDYHVGVVSTDMWDSSQSGKLRSAGGYRYIDVDTVKPTSVFTSMAQMGTSGDATERGRAAAYTALEIERNGYNAGFYRDDASLSIIVISDENDYSGANPITKNEFINWLSNLKTSLDMVSFSSIVAPPGSCSTAYEAGAQYLDVTDAVGGIKWSVCSDDYATVLDELGMQAAGLRREFYLSRIPVIDSIEVKVIEEGNTLVFFNADSDDCVVEEECFEYDATRNSVRFLDYVPSPLAEVQIDYEILAGSQDDDSGDDEGDEE